MQRFWITIGSLFGCATVGMAAISAHVLATSTPETVRLVHGATEMQGWHALALIGTGLWARRGGWLADAAGAAFTIGLLMFCGAVYSLAFAKLSLGMIAPLGGSLCMLGWLVLALSAMRANP